MTVPPRRSWACGGAHCPWGAALSRGVPPQVKELEHRCIIRDAWKGERHRVQLRAQEEFGLGSWSTWSPEATGAPWTGTVWARGSRPYCLVCGYCVAGHPQPALRHQPLWKEATGPRDTCPWWWLLLLCGRCDRCTTGASKNL